MKTRSAVSSALTLVLTMGLFLTAAQAANPPPPIVVTPSTTPRVSSITASDDPYDPNAGSLTFTYKLADINGSATIYMEIYDDNGVMQVDLGSKAGTTGTYTIPWDGKFNMFDNPGEIAPDGDYTFKASGSGVTEKIIPFEVDRQPAVVSNMSMDTTVYNTATDTDGVVFTYDLSNVHPDEPATLYLSIGTADDNPVT